MSLQTVLCESSIIHGLYSEIHTFLKNNSENLAPDVTLSVSYWPNSPNQGLELIPTVIRVQSSFISLDPK